MSDDRPASASPSPAPEGSRIGAALRGAAWRGRARQVRALLEEERELILQGDLRGLAGHAARSRTALEDFLSSPPAGETPERELERIRDAAARNRRLLAALLEGAAAARQELAQHEKARSQLGYDRSGGVVTGSGPGRGRRA
ncbi:hypothetical protein P2H44_23840 [Albimonas sp. CAU 1670]|uniref:hypothetical protein n=1 Tax=Albimonas sp. CAU 1670 TaxID=3032599 RepID=UPI0023DB489D|nr:hypothetical protein [Albimonas sp. CAU 1670]MDF2235600.1 hypothetical protein [Albimonas sp. CAU 1670]